MQQFVILRQHTAEVVAPTDEVEPTATPAPTDAVKKVDEGGSNQAPKTGDVSATVAAILAALVGGSAAVMWYCKKRVWNH